jgi:phospholipase/lecithinase/hemolysin
MRNLIKKSPLKTLISLTAATLISASANAFDEIYIFGDSLSDTGNAQAFSGNPAVPARFSNGPVAVDVIAAALGTSATPSLFLSGQQLGNNYAVGGAQAVDADRDESTYDTNLPTQVNLYLAYNGFQASATDLHAVIIGGNDLFEAATIRSASIAEESGPARQDIRKAAEARVTEAVASLEAQLMKLVGAGARNLLVASAPDVSQVPSQLDATAYFQAIADDKHEAKRASKFPKYVSKLVSQYNGELSAAVARVEALAGIDIVEWDLASFLSNQIEDAESLGYDNVTDGCIEDLSNLPECEGFLFFDGVHPTTASHQAGALEVLDLLQ